MGDGKSFSCYNSHGGYKEFDLLANGNNHEGWEEFDLLTGLTMDGGGGGGDRKTLTVHGNNLWGWDKYCFEALMVITTQKFGRWKRELVLPMRRTAGTVRSLNQPWEHTWEDWRSLSGAKERKWGMGAIRIFNRNNHGGIGGL